MTDQNPLPAGTDVFDVLADTDLSGIDTSMPVLVPGAYEFTVDSMEVQHTNPSEKYPNGGSMLVINLKLAQDTETADGKAIHAGFPVRTTIWMVASEKYDPREQLAALSDALVGKDENGNRPRFDVTFETYHGLSVVAVTKIEPARKNPETGEEFTARTGISRFVAKS